MEIAGAVEHAYRAGLRPRMATLNTCSMSVGASEFRNPPADVRRLTARMLDLGVKPELYDTGHLEACLRLRDEGLLGEGRPQFSIMLGVAGGMAATPDNLLMMVRLLPSDAIWQVIATVTAVEEAEALLSLTAAGSMS